METLKEEELKKMPYEELRKYAMTRGVRASMKASDIIARIVKDNQKIDDSFEALEQQIINSCKKNKEKKFDEDKMVAVESPRRETYIVENQSNAAYNTPIINPANATPPSDANASINITMTRGSERKTRQRKVSFAATPVRRSSRLNADNSETPQFLSVRDRPKTPIPKRCSSTSKKTVSFATDPAEKKSSVGTRGRRPSTPMPKSNPNKRKLSEEDYSVSSGFSKITHFDKVIEEDFRLNDPSLKKFVELSEMLEQQTKLRYGTGSACSVKNTDVSSSEDVEITQPSKGASSTDNTDVLSAEEVKITQPSISEGASSAQNTNVSSTNDVKITQPSNVAPKISTPLVESSVKSKVFTPNFKAIHEREFSKMESIADYQERKVKNSAQKLKQQLDFKSLASKKLETKKAAPKKHGGIHFVPSVKRTRNLKLKFGEENVKPKFTAKKSGALNKTAPKSENKTPKGETPLKKRFKFDLQASLSKKLPYKPHRGPLKPLSENAFNVSLAATSMMQAQKAANSVVQTKRKEARNIMQDTRKNKRFDMQMRRRNAA